MDKRGAVYMSDTSNVLTVLKKIDILERELINIKREILHSMVGRVKPAMLKPSLFGSVKGGDITEEMIDESKKKLFRNVANV